MVSVHGARSAEAEKRYNAQEDHAATAPASRAAPDGIPQQLCAD